MSGPPELALVIRRDGYVVARELISPRDVREIKDSLAPWLQERDFGRNDDARAVRIPMPAGSAVLFAGERLLGPEYAARMKQG